MACGATSQASPIAATGCLLIRACMDTITIERSSEGTTVRMQRAIGPGRAGASVDLRGVDGAGAVT